MNERLPYWKQKQMLPRMRKYKIYVLICPIEKVARYIGCTIGNLRNRRCGHISEAKYNLSNAKNEWILSLLEIGLKPKIELVIKIENISKAADTEIMLIKQTGGLFNQGYIRYK